VPDWRPTDRILNSKLLDMRLRKMLRLARKPSLWPAALRGTVASLEHGEIPFAEDFCTVIDVGANRGQFALFAADLFPDSRIICFEPLPAPADRLDGLLDGRVEVHRVALGSEPGRAKINISASDDSSSLLPIGSRQKEEFPGTEAIGTLEVEVSTLDHRIPSPPVRPCLLKIDVQGLEGEVLKGAAETLESVDQALIECSYVELYEGQPLAPEIITQMKSVGFSVVFQGTALRTNDGELLQANLLFARDKG